MSTTYSFDWDDLILAVWRRVMDDPDWVDPNAANGVGCEYAPANDSGGCVIGQALGSLGVDNEKLRQLDDKNGAISTPVIFHLLRLPDGAPHLLTQVQSAQDEGSTWLEAWKYGMQRDKTSFPAALKAKGVNPEDKTTWPR